MNKKNTLDFPLLSLSMMAVLFAQFFSALGDNIILVGAIAMVKSQKNFYLVPLLQEAFFVPFIFLAPFVGQISDGFPKGRVMLLANALKFLGAVAMLGGVNPLLAYGVIGIGAALYSPAKYGILTQMFSPESLVRANGMIEGSTIVAILLGVVIGGNLADYSLHVLLYSVLAIYTLAVLANIFIPTLAAEKPSAHFIPWKLLMQFARVLGDLFRHPDTRFSLLGTGSFWGSGTTLRLMLFAWVPIALGLHDIHTPANLMGGVSMGIVCGAVIAGLWVTLKYVNRALLGGLLLGPTVLMMLFVHSLPMAFGVMILVGVFGGIFVVPLNALLQERGHETVGAGNALAVQNFVENIAMLLFVAGYTLLIKMNVSIHLSLLIFGGALTLIMTALAMYRIRTNLAS